MTGSTGLRRPAGAAGPPDPVAARTRTPRASVLAVVAIVALAGAIHVAGVHQPLDRDMGAHAAIAAYWVDGLLPYVEVIDNKQPLTYGLFALPALVADGSTVVVRLFGAAVNVAALLALVVAARRHLSPAAWVAASAVAAAWGASTWVQGTDLNTEHLLAPFATAAVALALSARTLRGALAAGACVAAAGMIKAPGVVVVVPVVVALATDPDRARRLGAAAVGALATGLALAAPWVLSGHSASLWFWNVAYNLGYSADGGVVDPGPLLRLPAELRSLEVLLWTTVAVAVVRAVRSRDRVDVVAVVWLVLSIVGALIGRRDAPHYFIPVIAPAAVAWGRTVDAALTRWQRWRSVPADRPTTAVGAGHLVAVVTWVVVLGLGIGDAAAVALATGEDRCTLLYRTSCVIWRQHDGVGTWLRDNAAPGDEMFVVGNEPGFYWAAGLHPAAPPIVDFPRQTVADFDATVDAALAADPPRWLVFPYGFPQYHPYLASLQPLGYEPAARFGGVLIHRLPAGASPGFDQDGAGG